jgi:hypothetical protein
LKYVYYIVEYIYWNIYIRDQKGLNTLKICIIMENTNQTDGKTSTESIEVTEMQNKKLSELASDMAQVLDRWNQLPATRADVQEWKEEVQKIMKEAN